ncbi:winged helix-turn-helix domain-containing protein [Streptomyces chartreusis]|uniref:helix-turn-helix domain-containing protein n=1 Tax=Streptomyces chartreusis TaxID=1969 RepID=UPI0033EA3A18
MEVAWPVKTWTPARIRTLFGRRFHKSLTQSAVAQMRHRHRFSHQVPARRPVERGPPGRHRLGEGDLATAERLPLRWPYVMCAGVCRVFGLGCSRGSLLVLATERWSC